MREGGEDGGTRRNIGRIRVGKVRRMRRRGKRWRLKNRGGVQEKKEKREREGEKEDDRR